MTEPRDESRFERGPGVVMEDLQLMLDLEQTRDAFITQAAILFASPDPDQHEKYDSCCNEWLDHVRQYVAYMTGHESSVETALTRLEIIAAQYLYEDRAINTALAQISGNTTVFYPTIADTDEIVRILIESDDEDCEPADAILANFMESLTDDVHNFELIALAQADDETEEAARDDEGENFYPVDELPSKDPTQPESRRKRLAKQTLKVAANIAAMTLAVYLGNTLSERTSSRR